MANTSLPLPPAQYDPSVDNPDEDEDQQPAGTLSSKLLAQAVAPPAPNSAADDAETEAEDSGTGEDTDDESTGGGSAAAPATPADPNTPAHLSSLQQQLEQVRALAASRGADTSKYDEMEDQARQMFEDRSNRAEWLSLANRIGDAAIRLGAAQQGLRAGVNLANVGTGPEYDKAGEERNALAAYQTQLTTLQHRRQAAIEQGRYDVANQLKSAEAALSTERDIYNQQQQNSRAAGSQSVAAQRAADLRDYRDRKLGLERDKLDAGPKAGKPDRYDQNRSDKQDVADAKLQSSLEGKLSLGESAVSDWERSQGLGAKQKSSVQQKASDKAAKAEIELPDEDQWQKIQDDPQNSEPGRFFGTNTSTSKVHDALIHTPAFEKLRTQLQEVKQRRAARQQGTSAAPTAATPPPALPAPPAGPPVGTIQNGYRYTGGDPAQQQNWQKVQ